MAFTILHQLLHCAALVVLAYSRVVVAVYGPIARFLCSGSLQKSLWLLDEGKKMPSFVLSSSISLAKTRHRSLTRDSRSSFDQKLAPRDRTGVGWLCATPHIRRPRRPCSQHLHNETAPCFLADRPKLFARTIRCRFAIDHR